MGGANACLVIDYTALPKKGTRSVGVARQYCGHLGKKATCQSLVSLNMARDEVPVPVGLRLFLPEEWTADPARCAPAGVPEAAISMQSKGEIALTELDRLQAVGVRFGVVLADAGYGCSAVFRQAWVSAWKKDPACGSCRHPARHANPCRIRSRGRPRRLWPRCLSGA